MTSFRWLSLFVCLGAAAAQPPKIGGDYVGMLGPLHLKLHLKVSASGATEGSMDSVDQGAMGLPCANFRLGAKALSFDVPSVGGTWHGTVSADGATLDGSWSQGQERALVFRRDEPFAATEKPSRVDGIWLGTLETAGPKLRIQVQVKSDRAGKEYCSMDSLDQAAVGIPCDNVQFNGDRFSFEIPAAHGRWTGTLSPDGDVLDGTWSQGGDLPLRLVRQKAAIALKMPEPPRYDAALAPVPVGELKAVLDRDLAVALQDGALAPSTNGGVVIGVVQRGVRRLFVYGPVKENSIFEIGSISKTFTALILAQMAAQNKVKLDEYLEAQLHPDKVNHAPAAVAGDAPLGTLASALAMSHDLRADAFPTMKVALAWLCETKTGAFWHNGATGGYSSYALFDPREDYAVVVLFNTTISGESGSFADALGEHVAERISGRPAISLRE